MILTQTLLGGAYLVDPERIEDERGFFACIWDVEEFRARGLETSFVAGDIAWNARCGTLRGMHFQVPPYAETKLVRCTMGAIYDVIIDLRPGSPTQNRWFAVELSAENRRILYVPKGLAHGYLTLTDGAEVAYEMSEGYHPAAASGVRWSDPAFSITWPREPVCVASRDTSYPLLAEAAQHP